MQGHHILPVELWERVAQYSLRTEIASLARTCKALQAVAEPKLYQILTLREPMLSFRVLSALAARGCFRAPYVRRFWMWQDLRLGQRVTLPEQFWQLVQRVLMKMVNLESLYLHDETYSNTWMFQQTFPFQLKEIHLRFFWDEPLVAFLVSQTKLKLLTVWDPGLEEEDEGGQRVIPHGSFPALETFEGPLYAGVDLLSCDHLKRICLSVDEENSPLFATYLPALASSNSALTSLSIVMVPEYLVSYTLQMLGTSPLAARLRHLGLLSLPVLDRDDVHRSLMKFARLEVVQVDVTHWHPVPTTAHHRMLATELRTYCTTLRIVVFWNGTQETLWRVDNNEQWSSHQFPGPRNAARESLWREY